MRDSRAHPRGCRGQVQAGDDARAPGDRFPGWHASIDGRAARIDRVGGIFQAIALAPGSHRVTFSFSPPGIEWAYGAFAAGVAWLLLGCVPPVRTGSSSRGSTSNGPRPSG